MNSRIQTAPLSSLIRPMSAEAYKNRLWALTEQCPGCRLHTIGTTAAGRSIYAVSVGGEGELPSVVYAGGFTGTDWLSAAVLLHFLEEYSRLLAEDGRLYRVHLPYLFASRRICVCPMVNWDAAEQVRTGTEDVPEGYTGKPSADPAAYFAGKEPAEKCPEGAALRQYLLYQEPGLFVCLQGGGKGVLTVPEQPSPRAVTVGRLLSRMLSLPMEREEDDLSVVPGRYASESGHMAYGVSLGEKGGEDGFYRGYTAIREFLYSAPLLI